MNRLRRRRLVSGMAVLALASGLVAAGGLSASAAPITASLSVSKNAFEAGTTTPLSGPVTPGESFDYQLSAACSGLTQGCINAKTVDVIPKGITIQVPPSQPPLYTVSYVAPTRTLTITYTDALASPPNPDGSKGIRAGSTRTATISATLDADTIAPDGSTITNTADATADNTNPSDDSADITVAVPKDVKLVASKSMTPSSVLAQSGATTTATLGVRNASSSSTQVTSLTIADTSKDTWDDFDLISLGPVEQFPAGADEVAVRYCTEPAPCTPDQFTTGPFVPGSAVSLPAGVDPATVTGIGFVFANSQGTILPTSKTGAVVPIVLKLRGTVRSTGATLDPTRPLAQQNCATPSAVEDGSVRVTGTPVCVGFTVQPGAAGIAVSKAFFPDATGRYTNNGYAVAGQNSGVSAVSTGKNTSAFPVTNLTLTEPSTSSGTNFADLDTTQLRLVFPTGASTATGAVTCRDGSTVPFSVAAPPGTVNRPTGCPQNSPPSRITVTYTGTIPAGASAQLGVHGTLNSGATGGATLSNCVDGAINGGTQGSATGTGCATLPVEKPRTTVGGVKNVSAPNTGGALVPGQPLNFVLQATNNGNLPQTGFTITDPDPASTHPNPFTVVRLTGASVSAQPAALAKQFVIEVYDPTVGNWVSFDASNAALLERATGIRARLASGLVQPTNTVILNFSVLVRDGIETGAKLTNCQRTTVASEAGSGNSGDVCAPALTVAAPQTAGQVAKVISPSAVARPIAGVPPQTAQVQLRTANTGNLPLSKIVVTDPDETQDNPRTFFDATTLTSINGVNFPVGADRIQVDACTSVADCAAGTYTLGGPAASPALPTGISAADVLGLRFTFTSSKAGPGDFLLYPGTNFPANGPCPNATVCFSVAPRATLRSDPSTPIPDSLTNIATGGGVTPISDGAVVPFGSAPAALAITAGTIQLGTTKTAVPGSVGPGTPIGYTLATRNTGTGAVPALSVTEPIPAGIVFDQTYAGDGGQPYTMTFTVPPGTPAPPQPTFTAVLDPATRAVTSVSWQFPDTFSFLPGSTISFQIQATLAPGTSAGTKITNTFGASTTDPDAEPKLTCATGSPLVTGLGCSASATVTAQSGSAINAQKWVHGDDSRGFYNTRTNTFVAIGDPVCPLLTVGSDNYTRFPCVALVLAGQDFSFLLNLTNVGTTPATQTRIVDDLPMLGDRGVIVPSPRGTEWDPRPVLSGAPSIAPGKPGALSSLGYTDTAPGCINDLSRPPGSCPPGSWKPSFNSSAQAFRTFIDFATPLAPAQSTQLIVPMSAPADLDTTGNQLPIAWNSFAHTDFFRQPNGSITQLPAVEPIKVGVAMPFGNLNIVKHITGDIPPGSIIGPFSVEYSCVVRTAGGQDVTVAHGNGKFSDTAPLTVAHVPAGAVCTVHETDTGGSNATDPSPLTILPDTNPDQPAPTIATVTNDFPAPRLIITKAVDGAAAAQAPGPFMISVNCQLNGAPVPGYPLLLSFPDASSQSITDLPIGALCTVSEPDDRGATSTSIHYSDGDHAVISALVDGVASITNTYNAAHLIVNKRVVGPGSAGPYTFAASCTLTSSSGALIPVPLETTDSSFSLSNGQSHTITVPTNSTCVVRETNLPKADTVTYNAAASTPPLKITTTTRLDIVNTFHPSPTTPPTTAPPSSTPPPTSPTAPPTVKPSTPNGAGNDQATANTGTDVAASLAIALALLAAGTLLGLAARRRRPRH